MALANRLSISEPKTKFEAWLDSLTDANRSCVESWLNDMKLPNARVARMIRDDDPEDDFEGYRATNETIASWRREHGTH